MSRRRFVGGLNVPDVRWGRLSAGWPLGVLTIADGRISLVPRGPFRGFSGGVTVPLSDVSCAFPLRGRLVWPGVGFDYADGKIAYFWTYRQRAAVLDLLRHLGVRIDSEPRSPVAVRKPWLHSG